MLFFAFLVTSFAPRARPLGSLGFFQDGVHVILRSASLERRLAPLEVTSVILGTDEGHDDEVGGHNPDEDSLDEGIVRYVFWAVRPLNCRAGVLSAGYGSDEMSENNPAIEGDLRTSFDLSRSRRDHVAQLVSNAWEGGSERGRGDFRQ